MSIGQITRYAADYAPYRAEGAHYNRPNNSGAADSGSIAARPPQDEYIPSSDNILAQDFTLEELQIISNLQTRDREVRAHEQAHISAGGAHIRGGASYEYQVGPDKKRYAVGGEVSIDTSPVRDDPQATIAKMQTVRAAALAPASPSGQDRAVAAAASQAEARAHAELSEKRAAETQGNQNGGSQNAAPRIFADAIAAYTINANSYTARIIQAVG